LLLLGSWPPPLFLARLQIPVTVLVAQFRLLMGRNSVGTRNETQSLGGAVLISATQLKLP
jgi:hypothetical protein